MTTMYSAPVARLIRSAAVCTGPVGAGAVESSDSVICGWAAVLCAMASTVTPVAMANCISRTWEKTRCGQPSRRALLAVGGGALII